MRFIELLDSPKLSNKSATLHYVCLDEPSADTVKLGAAAEAPVLFGELPRANPFVEVTPFVTSHDWDVVCHYESQDGKNDDSARSNWDYEFSFDFTTQNQKITHSLETVSKVCLDGANKCPDFHGAINFDGKTIHGVDMMVPTGAITEKWTVPASVITDEYRRNLALMVGRTNNAPWRGYSEEELLFHGVAGSISTHDSNKDKVKWTLSYKWLVSRTEQNLFVGGLIVLEKRGWHYLWTYTKEGISTVDGKNFPTRLPYAAFVEKVYPDDDYGIFGLDGRGAE